jgi:hypothetical protein
MAALAGAGELTGTAAKAAAEIASMVPIKTARRRVAVLNISSNTPELSGFVRAFHPREVGDYRPISSVSIDFNARDEKPEIE